VVVTGVLRWMSLPLNKHWLLFIDNVDRDWNTRDNNRLAYNVRGYLPQGVHGSILVTSRLAGESRTSEGELLIHRVDDEQARNILESNACKELEGVSEGNIDRMRPCQPSLTTS
jgi:hypothetical protein